jgi:hypothetical protein
MDASFGPGSRGPARAAARRSRGRRTRVWWRPVSRARGLVPDWIDGHPYPAGARRRRLRSVSWQGARWVLVLAAAGVPVLLMVPPIDGTAAAHGPDHRSSAQSSIDVARASNPLGHVRHERRPRSQPGAHQALLSARAERRSRHQERSALTATVVPIPPATSTGSNGLRAIRSARHAWGERTGRPAPDRPAPDRLVSDGPTPGASGAPKPVTEPTGVRHLRDPLGGGHGRH